jgi:signal peptidase I
LKKKFLLQEILNVSVYLLIVLIITLGVVKFVGERTRVNGDSMESTLSNGDNLIVNKITYHFKEPKRFDIIVFPFKYANQTYYIKRIIGLPGETVRIDENGSIYINDELLEESYGTEVIREPGLAAEGITLGKDEYFVLGDNRNKSVDSRDPSVGVVSKSSIIGKAWLRIYPFNKFGRIA